MTKRKGRLYRHANKTKQWTEFNNYQQMCKKEFKNAEMDYVNKTIQEGFDNNNSKPFWRYIKSKSQDNIGTAPLKRKGTLISDSKDKAQILVEQFRSVFTKMGNHVLPVLPMIFKHELPDINITTSGVEKLHRKLTLQKLLDQTISQK